jgi:hypothetical protein
MRPIFANPSFVTPDGPGLYTQEMNPREIISLGLFFFLIPALSNASHESIRTYPSGMIENQLSKMTVAAEGKPLYIPSAMSAPWGKNPRLSILLVQMIDATQENRYDQCNDKAQYTGVQRAELYLFREVSPGKYERAAGPFSMEDLKISPCGPAFNTFRFDLAPYQISDSQRAFGIRANINTIGRGPGGQCRDAESEMLHLFVFEHSTLKLTLSTQMYDAGYDDNCKQVEKKLILRVLNSKTNGYYDLEKKCVGSPCERTSFKWSTRYFESDGAP